MRSGCGAMPKGMSIRVRLQDQFLISPRGVKRVGAGIFEHRLADLSLNANPRIICKDVQDWLLQNIGHEQTCRHALDHYYYPGDVEPTFEELKKAPKVRQPNRRWRKGVDRDATGKYERFIHFYNDEDEGKIMTFLMKFGKDAQKNNRAKSK